MKKCLKIAFVAGLSDKKLLQKLQPLGLLPSVGEIHLFRRYKLDCHNVCWVVVPAFIQRSVLLSEIFRFFMLLLNGWKYDIFVGCNQAYHGVFAFIAGMVYHKPVIQVVTTDVDLIVTKSLLRKALLSADACAVRGGVSSEKLRMNGYGGHIEILANFFPFISQPSQIYEKEYDLVFVSHYTSDAKDFPWLLSILSELKKKRNDFRIAIAGNGHRQILGKDVQKLGLSENVFFTGELHASELEQLYLKSRILLLTSKVEGLPMVIVEAMALGLPMVVTDVGDIPWLVKDGIEAYIVRNGSTEKAVSAICAILDSPDMLESMGRRSRNRYDEIINSFQPAEIAKSWGKLISSAMGETVK